ncbi:Citrate-sodium symporter [invertebrate metagenome]|uniref:Citrate-sodium symporter n=1 Tax=invertebrate metagenome TaxID=1711999 RepID=A0A2H9TAF9_9ZZZZ
MIVASILPRSGYRLIGIDIRYFIPIAVVIGAAVMLDMLPQGMLGAFPLMMISGAVLNELGNRLPVVKDYLGGGPIVVIFVAAALASYQILPQQAVHSITFFMKTEGFLNFYIAALICGSILGMDRKLLLNAAIRYLPVIIGGVFCACLFTGIVGALLGYGFKEAMFYIAIPIMGGGMGAGAVPLAEIFGHALHTNSSELLSIMVPAVALGNASAIVCAGILNKLGKKYPVLSGDGKLMQGQQETSVEHKNKKGVDLEDLGRGVIFATTFYIFGTLLSRMVPLHPYALMILSVAAAKGLGIINRQYEECAAQWFQFIMKNFTAALLVGIGIAYTDFNAIVNAFSLLYVTLVVTTIVGAIIGTALVGRLMKFYMIEASLTAGLCMANMGGSGDVAVLSAANRMELMPFSQISSRIGGAFMLIATSLIIHLFA